jgi:TetR/AcrR family transcriptional regulator, regulator of cefoperazone and chloramphenicol sensitivity
VGTSTRARSGVAGAGGRDSRERILRAATAAFAARGFDGVSIRDLAAVVDLDVATVQYHVGRKAELFTAVFARLQARELETLERIAARLDDATLADAGRLAAAVLEVVDLYLDLLVEEPAVAALWVRSWVDEPHPIPDLWERFALPQYQLIEARLAAGVAAGALRQIDARLLLRTLVWTTHGYVTGGVPGSGADPRDPDELANFRRFLKDLVTGLALRDGASPTPDPDRATTEAG